MAALLTSALRCMLTMMSWSAAAPRSQRVREGRRVEVRRAAPLGDKASSEENGSTGTVSPARWLDVDLGTVAKQSAAEWFDGTTCFASAFHAIDLKFFMEKLCTNPVIGALVVDVVSPFCKPYHMATASPCWFSINVQIKTGLYVRVIICLRPVTSVTSQAFFDKKKFEQENGLLAAPRIFGGCPSGTSDLEPTQMFYLSVVSHDQPDVAHHPGSLSSSSRTKTRDLLQAMERALSRRPHFCSPTF